MKLGYSLMDDLEALARYRDHPVHREHPDFRSHEQFSSPHHYSAMFTIKYLFGRVGNGGNCWGRTWALALTFIRFDEQCPYG